MKICCRCEIEKPRSEFHNKTSSKDGLDNRCKDCKRNYNKTWVESNKDHVRKYNREFVQNQRRDPMKRMYKNLMARASKFKKRKGLEVRKSYKEILGCSREYRMYKNVMSRASKFKKKRNVVTDKSYAQILGCTKEYLAKHLESKFDENMSWDNYGSYWEIDHEIELFRCHDVQDFELINHFTNLRPLEKNKNRMRNYE